jgi:hypothetical protein
MPQRARAVIAWSVTVIALVAGIGFWVYVLTGRSLPGTLIVAIAFVIVSLPVAWWVRTARSS